jgi:hypothetical protein
MMELRFGCTRAIPDEVKTAWGARWIFPADMIWDRQDLRGPEADRLKKWLNSGALRTAAAKAQRLSSNSGLTPDGDETVTLYEDACGIIRGSPQRSFGYLYVAAWLKIPT